MTRAKRSQGKEPVRLTLPDSVTIRTARDLHARLAGLLQAHDRIEIDSAAVAESDLSLVQLLLSARRSAERAGKSLTLAQPISAALRDVLARGGLLSSIESEPGGDGAFWLGGAAGQ